MTIQTYCRKAHAYRYADELRGVFPQYTFHAVAYGFDWAVKMQNPAKPELPSVFVGARPKGFARLAPEILNLLKGE